MKTIHINIDHQRAELYVCLPEFGRVLSGLMEDQALYIKLVRQLASKLGNHGLKEEMLQEEARLEAEVDKAFRLVDMFAIEEEEWIETQDYESPVLAAPKSQDILDGPAKQSVADNTDTIQFTTDTEVGSLTPATQTQEHLTQHAPCATQEAALLLKKGSKENPRARAHKCCQCPH
jgi:hypothetical protein